MEGNYSIDGVPGTGAKITLKFIEPGGSLTGKLLPTEQTLEMARAGSFVREMFARGVPADTVSIGMKQGSPGKVTMWFYVRAPQEVDAYYRSLRGEDDVEDQVGPDE